jgi:hypothetical protein
MAGGFDNRIVGLGSHFQIVAVSAIIMESVRGQWRALRQNHAVSN